MKKLFAILLFPLLAWILPTHAGAAGNQLLGVYPSPSSLFSYSTSFSSTENPISEGSRWTNGGTTGLDWQNVRTTSGSPNLAYGSGLTDGCCGYNDNIAVLSGFSTNQSVQATIYLDNTYTAPDTHEIELLLRFKISANVARGYEVDYWFAGGGVQIIRWNGALNDVVEIPGATGPGISSLVTGDVIKATVSGSTINVYKNGSLVKSVTDATYTDGSPGVGFFVRTGGTPNRYCISALTASNLP